MSKWRPLFLKVTADKYELPLIVADNPYELAAMAGLDVTTIYHAITKEDSPYKKIWVEWEEEEIVQM